jgi:tripartite ATP-independent transporter DctP family solute receptor
MKLRIVIIYTALVLLGACKPDTAQVKRLKLAHTMDTKHPVHQGLVFMGEQLAQYSNGRMELQIYPNSQLGGERECLELLQIGSLAMTKVSAYTMEGFAPNFKILTLPYIFSSRAHAFKILDGPIGKSLLDQSVRFKLKGLGFYDAGSRSFYTRKEAITEPSKLQGLKIRVMSSNTAVNMIKALGGSPTPISFGELYTALQQGVVDGAENNPPSFYNSKHYEVCKYYSLDEHTTVPDVLVISTEWWNRLSAEEKEWVSKAADASIAYQRKLWMQAEQEALEAMSKEGAGNCTNRHRLVFHQHQQ